VVEFKNTKDIARWLEGKPHMVATVIAVRAALRTVPAFLIEGRRKPGAGHRAILLAFRAVAASWAVTAYPTRDELRDTAAKYAYYVHVHEDASRFALEAIIDATSAAANRYDRYLDASKAAVLSATSAAYATGAAQVPASLSALKGADVAAAEDASLSLRDAVADDARVIEEYGLEPEEIARQPLWPNGMPPWAAVAWSALADSLLSRHEGDWEVWTKWYEARLRWLYRRGARR
jgi:hypothetical protein